MREMRSKKAALNLYKVSYFLSSTLWGYSILRDRPWFPACLGGSGDIVDTFRGYPYAPQNPQEEMVKLYMLVTQGYHLESLISHFVLERRNDYIEMALHHIVTIYLYSGCYLMNCTQIGAVIAFLHDVADVTTPLCKMWSETRYSHIAIACFISNVFLWGYTRNLVFPWVIYSIIFKIKDDFNGEPLLRPYFAFLLSCLAVLHYYWLYLMYRILSHYWRRGECDDIQNKL